MGSERVDLDAVAAVGENGLTVGGVTITYDQSSGYTFKVYDYGEGGTHESKAMDEFLGEDDVTFTEETLLGLNLYFTVGDDSEIESVYLMDPVYGAVYVYGDLDTLYPGASGGTSWPWTGNATYAFDEDLEIYFYQSTDKVAADWTVTSSTAGDYNDCTDPLFSAILADATCAGEAIAIGYFECAECGTPVPVYAYKAHTFDGDGLDLVKASNASSGWVAEHSWTDATCTEAASHIGVCTDENCKQEILIYGEGKLGHSYDYAIAVDEADNWIEITATCDRCGHATAYGYTLYVAYADEYKGEATYHLTANPLTGRAYYELCDGTCSKDEVLYVLNPEIAGLSVARYAETDVTYDEKTGTWTIGEDASEGDPTCTEGAYDVYTLDGSDYSSSIGATYVNEEADEEVADIADAWYVEPTGNLLKLDKAYNGSEYYTIYSAQAFKINPEDNPGYDFANYVYADASEFFMYVRLTAEGDIMEAWFYDLDGTQMFIDTSYVYEVELGDATCATSFETWITVWCACGDCEKKTADGDVGASMVIDVAEASLLHSFGAESDYLLSDGTFDYATYQMAVAEKAAGETGNLTAWLQFTIEEEPTCGGAGVASVTCSACGGTFYFEIAALEHDYVAEYDPDLDKIVLTCANADVCGTDPVYIDAHFVRLEAATCEEYDCEVYVGYYEETNRFYQARYETGTEYGKHTIAGIEIELGTAGRGFDAETDTVYYLDEYEGGSRIYTIDGDGSYVLLYDTGAEGDPAYGVTTGIVYYYGYLYIYTVGTGASAKTYTVMFVVEAGEDEESLESLVDHMGSHHTHEYEADWGAYEQDEDGKVLLWRWVEDDNSGYIQYYARCRYDGQYVRVFRYSELGKVDGEHYVIVNGDQDATEDYAEAVMPEAADGWTWDGTEYTGAKLAAGTAFFEGEGYTVIATYTYDGTVYEAACVVSEGLGVENYTVTLTLLEGYTWADGTDGTKTFTFYNYLENVAEKKSADIALEKTYGELSTVLTAIADLVGSSTDFTVTIDGVTYSYVSSEFQDEEGNKLSDAKLTAGTYTVVFSLADGYDAWADGVTAALTFMFTIVEGGNYSASTASLCGMTSPWHLIPNFQKFLPCWKF